MSNKYKPNPIDTSKVELSEDILALCEKLAENVHEVWANGRMIEGWTYGEMRDERLKTHASLVPYNELSEGEKNYDRNTSQETLKVLQFLGYKIVRIDE